MKLPADYWSERIEIIDFDLTLAKKSDRKRAYLDVEALTGYISWLKIKRLSALAATGGQIG